MNISVRGVDSKVFREFKAAIAREGMSMGTAMNMLMRHWFECFKKPVKKKASLLDIKPVSYGKGSEKSSVEIDEYLYGWKKS